MKTINLLFLLLVLISCRENVEKQELQEAFVMSEKMLQSTKIDTAKLDFVKNELSFFGKITADNNKMIEVFPVVGGNVTKVYVELGDYVKKGQLLATIRSTEVASVEKEMEDAQNDIIVTKNNLKVAQELYEGKLNTERDVIEAKSQYDKAMSQLNRVKETYKIYNLKAGAIYEVRSPLSGFIIQKNINQDMLLRSDKSDNIFDIAEIDEVWAVANVNESDIGSVQLGIDAQITTLSYPDEKFYGKVDKIYNIIDPETQAMKARVKLQNKNFKLKPDMRANIKLSFTEDKQLITVPSEALIFDNNATYIMIFEGKNNITTRQVEVYRQIADKAYLTSGLAAGERIITKNQLLIYDALND
ncbi:membrane fusion protein, cobalt-zinc-cadmium efflux system [Spirosomataceae bacterium TFI 002]|nr:membrane fusion protein, cobalt-zinc-cadmium efflux system [Spirosomataceae bacterium TFI 002]